MAEGRRWVALLSYCEPKGITVAVNINSVQNLVVTGGVAFPPKPVAGPGVVDSTSALERSNDGLDRGVNKTESDTRTCAHNGRVQLVGAVGPAGGSIDCAYCGGIGGGECCGVGWGGAGVWLVPKYYDNVISAPSCE